MDKLPTIIYSSPYFIEITLFFRLNIYGFVIYLSISSRSSESVISCGSKYLIVKGNVEAAD